MAYNVTLQWTKFMQMLNIGNNVGNNIGNNIGNNVGNNVGKDVGNMLESQLADRQTIMCKLVKDYPHISAKGRSKVLW